VTAKTGDLREVEGELVLEPVHGITRTTSQNTDEIITSEVAGLKKELQL
jgi:hypothetical protein